MILTVTLAIVVDIGTFDVISVAIAVDTMVYIISELTMHL